MSDDIVKPPESKNGKRTGSTQPLNGEFAKWLERQFRGGEKPQSIDAYPLFKGRDREQRLYHYDIKDDELIRAERAVELSNEIFSDCQIQCDALPRTALSKEGSKTYEISVIDERRGGLAQPVGTYSLKLMPRIHQPAPVDDGELEDLSSEDGDALTARKMILEVHKENTGRQERAQAGTLAIVGETMLLLKESLKDAFGQNRELHHSQLLMISKFQEMIESLGKRSVEEKAVAIDAANAEVEREAKRAQLANDHMRSDMIRRAMEEGIKVIGGLAPSFGQLLSAVATGKPIPPPPQQLPASGTVPATAAVGSVPSSGHVPEEKKLVDRFIEAAEKHKVDVHYTAAEKLFGKDGTDGKPIEPGVFTREQVAILVGVHMGSLSVEALDVLIPGSDKPEMIHIWQTMKAMAYLTPQMSEDITQVINMRKAARKS